MSGNEEQPMISFTDKEIEEMRQEALHKEIINFTIIDKMYESNPGVEYDDDEEVEKAEEYLEEHPELHEEAITSLKHATQPGTYDCHEALDRTSVIMHMLDVHLLDHNSIITNPVWFKLAYEAHTNLFNLYQQIGAVHIEAIPDNIVDLIQLAKKED